jgi:hypothetical protein
MSYRDLALCDQFKGLYVLIVHTNTGGAHQMEEFMV